MNLVSSPTPASSFALILLEFEKELLSEKDLYNERIMLRLRTARGLDLSMLSEADRLSVLESADNLLSDGSLVLENDSLRIPESRMFISDAVICSLFR